MGVVRTHQARRAQADQLLRQSRCSLRRLRTKLYCTCFCHPFLTRLHYTPPKKTLKAVMLLKAEAIVSPCYETEPKSAPQPESHTDLLSVPMLVFHGAGALDLKFASTVYQNSKLLLMIQILHPKLWELWYIPTAGLYHPFEIISLSSLALRGIRSTPW